MKDLKEIWAFVLEHRVVLAVLFCIISGACVLLTQDFGLCVSFGDSAADVGATIGGITTPIIGLISAFLLYKTLEMQRKQVQRDLVTQLFLEEFHLFAKKGREIDYQNFEKEFKSLKCVFDNLNSDYDKYKNEQKLYPFSYLFRDITNEIHNKYSAEIDKYIDEYHEKDNIRTRESFLFELFLMKNNDYVVYRKQLKILLNILINHRDLYFNHLNTFIEMILCELSPFDRRVIYFHDILFNTDLGKNFIELKLKDKILIS